MNDLMNYVFRARGSRISGATLGVVCLAALAGCVATSHDNPTVNRLIDILAQNMPPYETGYYREVPHLVCGVLSAAELDKIVGLKIGDHEITRDILNGVNDIEDKAIRWSISRSEPFRWSQSLVVTFEPSGDCSAVIFFRDGLS